MRAVFDYRNAKVAVEWMEEGPEGHAKLAKYPSLMLLMRDVLHAQDIVTTDQFLIDQGAQDVP